jgi:hypothetical protein
VTPTSVLLAFNPATGGAMADLIGSSITYQVAVGTRLQLSSKRAWRSGPQGREG